MIFFSGPRCLFVLQNWFISCKFTLSVGRLWVDGVKALFEWWNYTDQAYKSRKFRWISFSIFISTLKFWIWSRERVGCFEIAQGDFSYVLYSYWCDGLRMKLSRSPVDLCQINISIECDSSNVFVWVYNSEMHTMEAVIFILRYWLFPFVQSQKVSYSCLIENLVLTSEAVNLFL